MPLRCIDNVSSSSAVSANGCDVAMSVAARNSLYVPKSCRTAVCESFLCNMWPSLQAFAKRRCGGVSLEHGC